MKNHNTKNFISTCIFYGSLWGVTEAVLGYMLHLFPTGMAGFIMFPIGFYFMNTTYRKTKNVIAIFIIGVVAASIKLIDLLFPIVPVIQIVNPAVCIIFETLLVTAAFKIFTVYRTRIPVKGIVFISTLWRALFVVYTFVLTFFNIFSGLLESGYGSIIKFILFEGLANAAIIYIFTRLQKNRRPAKRSDFSNTQPVFSVFMFALASAVTLYFL